MKKMNPEIKELKEEVKKLQEEINRIKGESEDLEKERIKKIKDLVGKMTAEDHVGITPLSREIYSLLRANEFVGITYETRDGRWAGRSWLDNKINGSRYHCVASITLINRK